MVNTDPCQVMDGKIKPARPSKVHQLFVNSSWSLERCQAMGRVLGEMSALDGCHFLNDMAVEHCSVRKRKREKERRPVLLISVPPTNTADAQRHAADELSQGPH